MQSSIKLCVYPSAPNPSLYVPVFLLVPGKDGHARGLVHGHEKRIGVAWTQKTCPGYSLV